jgi:lipopolysaccharide/colanic/teichoic acid biosynthesis glycosyltransferase
VQHLKGCVRVRFHAAGSGSIIGSDFSSTSGETLSTDVSFKLGKPHYRRIKRLIDVAISGLFLLLFPLHFLFVKSPVRFLHHCLQVLFADKTWVGYITPREELPILRNGVLAPNGFFVNKAQSLPAETVHLLDYWYAKNYQPVHDLKIIYKNYVRLGE